MTSFVLPCGKYWWFFFSSMSCLKASDWLSFILMVALSMADTLRGGAEDFPDSQHSGSGILSQPSPQSTAACSPGLFSFQCINWGFWLHVLIKKTLVTCHKCRKNIPNVPGKLSAGSHPCLGSPYNFLSPSYSPNPQDFGQGYLWGREIALFQPGRLAGHR